jgi:hypothetical protein
MAAGRWPPPRPPIPGLHYARRPLASSGPPPPRAWAAGRRPSTFPLRPSPTLPNLQLPSGDLQLRSRRPSINTATAASRRPLASTTPAARRPPLRRPPASLLQPSSSPRLSHRPPTPTSTSSSPRPSHRPPTTHLYPAYALSVLPPPSQNWRSHHRHLAVDKNIAYHWKHKCC